MLNPGPGKNWFIFNKIMAVNIWTGCSGVVCTQKKHNNIEISVKKLVKNWIYKGFWGKTELSVPSFADLGFQLLTLPLNLAQKNSSPSCAIQSLSTTMSGTFPSFKSSVFPCSQENIYHASNPEAGLENKQHWKGWWISFWAVKVVNHCFLLLTAVQNIWSSLQCSDGAQESCSDFWLWDSEGSSCKPGRCICRETWYPNLSRFDQRKWWVDLIFPYQLDRLNLFFFFLLTKQELGQHFGSEITKSVGNREQLHWLQQYLFNFETTDSGNKTIISLKTTTATDNG